MPDDPLLTAARNLELGARSLVSLPDLLKVALAQQQTQQQIARTQAQPAVLQMRAELESRDRAQQGQVTLARAQGQAAFAQTAPGRAADQAAAAVGQQQSLADLQRASLAAQGQVAHLQTPQGQAEARQMRIEQNRLEEAQKQAQTLKEGPTSTMDSLGTAARGVTSVFGALRTVTSQVIGTLMEVGGKASPTHAATLQVSMDMLMAKIGTALLPAMEEMASAFQRLSRLIPQDKMASMGEAYADYLRKPGMTGWGTFVSTPLRAAETKPEFSMNYVREILGFNPAAKPEASYKGMPAPQLSTFEQQYDRMQMAALATGPADSELLQTQIRNLERIVSLLEKGTGPEAAVDVNFR